MRRTYHFAEGAVLHARGFTGLFAEDGVFTGIGSRSGPESYRGEHLGDVVVLMGKFLPDGPPTGPSSTSVWYVRDGKIQEFNCRIGVAAMFAQLGVLPDFASAAAASAPPR